MRIKNLLTGLALASLVFVLGAVNSMADQINLGDNTCVGGPTTIGSGLTISGAPTACTNDASLSSSGLGNITGLNWTLTPEGSIAGIEVFGSGNDLLGTLSLTSSTAIGSLDIITGFLTVGSVTGFNNEISVGGVYAFDLTLQGCGAPTDAGVTCTDPSSGEVPVPEPGTLALFGSGLFGLAGYVRRKIARF